MSSPPYMPLFVADYLADTGHLTVTEHGAYLLLLMAMWRAGGELPADDAKLCRFARCTPAQWARMRPTLSEFFEVDGGLLVHTRLRREMTKHADAVRQRREAASNGGKAKALKNKDKPLPDASSPLCQPEPEPELELNKAAVVDARDPAASPADDWPVGDSNGHAADLIELAASSRLDLAREHGLITTLGTLHRWRTAGASWSHDVVPAVIGLTRKQGPPIKTWTYFESAIQQSIAANRKALEIPEHERRDNHSSPAGHGFADRGQSRTDASLAGAALALARRRRASAGGVGPD